MKLLNLLMLALLSVILSNTAQAQFKGKVVDLISGDGIPGATVTASLSCVPAGASSYVLKNSVTTDADGNYEVSYPNGPAFCIGFLGVQSASYTQFIGRRVLNNGSYSLNFIGLKPDLPRWVGASAANYLRGSVSASSEMIMAGFGADLAKSIEAATPDSTLPFKLAGRTVKVTDYEGVERQAPLFFVSPSQVNYLLPPDLALGSAIVTLEGDDGLIKFDVINVVDAAPGIFSTSSDGRGFPAAVVIHVKADSSQTFEPVARFDTDQNKWVPVPIDLGPETDRVIVALFGTGWRHNESVKVSLYPDLIRASVLYAGKQPTLPGLDQINFEIPRSLRGNGLTSIELDVQTAHGATSANITGVSPVQIFIQ